MRLRPTATVRTDLDMLNSGAWIKVAKKHFRHVSGAELRYDCNRWTWEIVGGARDGLRFRDLWAARHEVERAAS